MALTTDPNDPRLRYGVDDGPTPQSEVYLVQSEEERAKGFIRPFRDAYIHVGASAPEYPLRDLTVEEKECFGDDWVKYEAYPPESESAKPNNVGKFWTQAQLDNIGNGCGTETIMGRALSETYARSPSFYGATFCTGCSKHLPVSEFVWSVDNQRVGS